MISIEHPPVAQLLKQVAGTVPVDAGSSLSIIYGWLALDVALVGLLIAAVVYHDRPIGVQARPELPKMTPTFPLVGNAYQIAYIILHQGVRGLGILDLTLFYQRLKGKGGKPYTFTFPGPNMGGRSTMINRPEYIQWVQKTNFECYDKGEIFRNNFSDLLSEHGIFASDGEVWRKQRKMASHIFSVSNFRTHVQKSVHQDLSILAQLTADAARRGVHVNLPDIFFRFTLDTFATMAFSADLECLPRATAGLKTEVEFAKAFDYAQLVVNGRFYNPIWKFVEIFAPHGFKMRSALKVLRKVCYDIIDKRLAAQASGAASGAVGSGGKDLLQLFMDQGLGREDLLPVVLNFIIAGRDTTAQALSWAFYELSKHPDVVEKIRAEADAVIGDRFMEYDDLKNITYTQAVFYEVLRLYPSVPKNLKVANRDDVIRPYAQDVERSDGNSSTEKELLPEDRLPDIRIQKGTTVVWSDWVMARMPEIWGPDCEEFKPERFLNEDGSLRNYSQYKFHAFNAGPRLCLGQTLATFEGCAVIIELLKKYDVVLDPVQMRKDPPMYSDSLTLPMANPYKAALVPVARA